MLRGRFIFAAALALVASGAMAATTPTTLINTDFTLQNPAQSPFAWTTAGSAGLGLNTTGSGPAVTLDLTHNLGSEGGIAWTLLSAAVPSFTMWADINLDFHP